MEINKLLRNGPLLAAVGFVSLLPMTSMAAIQSNCASTAIATTTPDARGLLNGMWKDADQVARHTESLQDCANHPRTLRRMQAEELASVRATVSDMNNRLCRLESMQASLPSAERHAISKATPLVRSITIDANAAIGDERASIAYGGYTQVINTEAEALANDIDLGEHAADLHRTSPEYQ